MIDFTMYPMNELKEMKEEIDRTIADREKELFKLDKDLFTNNLIHLIEAYPSAEFRIPDGLFTNDYTDIFAILKDYSSDQIKNMVIFSDEAP